MLLDARVDGRQVRVEVRGREGRYTVLLDGRELEVDLVPAGRDFLSLIVAGRSYEVGLERRPSGYTVLLEDDSLAVDLEEAGRAEGVASRPASLGPLRLTSPMPGKVVRILVSAGQEVKAGLGLVVIEAMKMENELRSPRAGVVKEIRAREGQTVEAGALLIVVE